MKVLTDEFGDNDGRVNSVGMFLLDNVVANLILIIYNT